MQIPYLRHLFVLTVLLCCFSFSAISQNLTSTTGTGRGRGGKLTVIFNAATEASSNSRTVRKSTEEVSSSSSSSRPAHNSTSTQFNSVSTPNSKSGQWVENKSNEVLNNKQNPFFGNSKSKNSTHNRSTNNSSITANYNFTETTSAHMKNPERRVPITAIDNTIKTSKAYPDPQGSSAKMYYSRMAKNDKMYNLEVLYHKESNTIWHFKYSKQAMGPLNKIQ